MDEILKLEIGNGLAILRENLTKALIPIKIHLMNHIKLLHKHSLCSLNQLQSKFQELFAA